MSLKHEGESCARCHAYLFDEDDIVYCPVCGAPHHRECYLIDSHCALEQLHGTENEYSREMAIENQKTTEEKKKSKGSLEEFLENESYSVFDFLGGVPKDYKLDEDVTAEEAKKFVLTNTHRYIPKFALLNKKNKISWNWGAFLFPCGWMFSRKMYKNGILTGLLLLASSILNLPFANIISSRYLDEAESYAQLAQNIYEALPDIGITVLIFAFLGFILELGIRIFAALFGDYIYKGFTISSIKKIKETSEDIEYDYQRKGGSNFFLLIIAEIALDFISRTILNLL